jgi:hypothetical protein
VPCGGRVTPVAAIVPQIAPLASDAAQPRRRDGGVVIAEESAMGCSVRTGAAGTGLIQRRH